ncbi:unnamed protein product [Diabrotica balteata]|uniref:Uncharacterized protein n=1 Tax=Diabrotica balteata TaxID=107213 RepID=A0A9N9SUC5_DIABA|nr:unnamed protein product [Diabrotica balteata]
MEVKQECNDNTCKEEVYSNKADDAVLDRDSLKCQKEDPNIESTHYAIDYLDLKEFPKKTEIKDESELWPFKGKQKSEKGK